MDIFLLGFRVIALLIAVLWATRFVAAIRKPADWQPSMTKGLPLRLSRNQWIGLCLISAISGLALLAWSFTPSFPVRGS